MTRNAEKLLQYKCTKCGHEWVSQEEKPKVCPNCKSPYWSHKKKLPPWKGRGYIIQPAGK